MSADTTYSEALATASPSEVEAADDVEPAQALRDKLIGLADAMAAANADPEPIDGALDLADAEEAVAEAARRVRLAEGMVADAQQALEAAEGMPVSDPCTGCHAARDAAVAAAEEDLSAAGMALAAARARLAEALAQAADLAEAVRSLLRDFHGGMQEATDSARTVAEREFHEARH
jgi:transcriptional accessory protein Tex/SPT6